MGQTDFDGANGFGMDEEMQDGNGMGGFPRGGTFKMSGNMGGSNIDPS